MREAILRKVRESAQTKVRFFEENAQDLERCAAAAAQRFSEGARLWVMGNGGSACDAQHVAVEFMHPIIEKRRPLPATALTVDTTTLTAIGNDTDFSHVFVRQLELLAHPKDIALGISTSGASANVNRALKRGKELGLLTVGFAGRDGGRMPEVCDYCFVVKSWSIHRIQETHTALLHLLWDLIHVALGRTMSSNGRAAGFGECPIPISEVNEILLSHGSGGKLTARLIETVFLPAFRNPALEALDDRAIVAAGGLRLAFTTDSYVVTPIFFPGGDIGELAVNGTINDLAAGGAQPLFLSVGFILEEGLPLGDLRRVVDSARAAAERAGVGIVTGDTKVVVRGSSDKFFVNTSGIGLVPPGVDLSSRKVRPRDAVLLSGSIGDHGVAIMSCREGLEFEGECKSDTAALHERAAAALKASPGIHAMRDPTRGGLAATLVEIASRGGLGVDVDEAAIPVRDTVRGACEILGLDPLFVASEGKLVVFVHEQESEAVLRAMRAHPLGRFASRIGRVTQDHQGFVVLRTPVGGDRVLGLPFGEVLPRIC